MPQIQTPESKGTRFLILIASAIAGLSLGWLVNCYELLAFMGIGFETHGAVSAVILVASLPTLIVLWWFRTHDTRQQIQKTQENINANLFGMYLKMLRANKVEERVSGLLGVVRMKQKGFFVEEIDSTTQQNLNLAGVNLMEKDLSGMNFSNADFRKALLAKADLSNVNLFKAKLSGVNLISAKLPGANLQNAKLSGANLFGANLMGANLEGANLEGADLGCANLRNANLTGADLQNVLLAHAKLIGANLQSVILDKANLEHADLSGANLTGSDLAGANLKNAKYNKATKLPLAFNSEEAEMVLV